MPGKNGRSFPYRRTRCLFPWAAGGGLAGSVPARYTWQHFGLRALKTYWPLDTDVYSAP